MTPSLRETQLRENVWGWTLGGERIETSYGANCTVVIGRESVLVVDPLIAPAHARRVESVVREKTSLPIRYVVLTHHHTDHALGAGWFAGQGVSVIAHRACADAMAAEHPGLIATRRRTAGIEELFRDAEPYRPSLVLDLDLDVAEWRLDLGDTVARVFHPGPGHTPGDLVVHLEKESLTICGDLVSAGYHVNYEDAAVGNLERGLERLRDLEARTYVPGHGAPGAAGILDDQVRYHRAVAAASASSSSAFEAEFRIREEFPGYRLREALPQSFRRWRGARAS